MANAQDTTTLEGNINTIPQTEAQAAQSLPQLPVISALAPALVSIATQSTPTSTIPTPSLTSKTSPSEPTTPPTPPALRAAGWCCRSQTSSSYQTTPESTVQASLIAALAREDAKDHPAGEEMEAGVTDAQWNAAVFHISVLDNLESRQQERDQLAAFVPVPGYELPSLSAPPPGRQERDILEDKARVWMLRGRKGKREKGKKSGFLGWRFDGGGA